MNTLNKKRLSAIVLAAISTSSTAAIAEPTIEFSGAVEVEINSGKDHTATKSSDIALATVELGLDAQINKNISAHVLMLHEDDDTDPPVIDEGIISYTADSVFMNAGRMYIPFGNYDSHMVSDPLTLELGETQEAAVEFGVESNGLRASVYVFNGNADQTDDVIDDFGFSINYSMKSGAADLNLGFDYINNMAETNSLEVLAGPTIQSHTAGIALHATINMDALTIIFEHVTATDDFNTADITFNGAPATPSATNIEVAYTMALDGREMTFAYAHQDASDIDQNAGLPESRDMISASTTIAGDVDLGVEFSSAKDYSAFTGESGGMLTVKMAVAF